ncbi:hypothetical protein J3R83DRAFT_10755, partial [Lanmaoa asiatica]
HPQHAIAIVEAFGKHWGNHSSFQVSAIDRSGCRTFTVNHFNSPVTYSSEGFLEHNLNLPISLFCGSHTAAPDG